MFMQLWGGHSPAGSAARPTQALTQQSPPARTHSDMHTNRHRHTHRGKHTCACAQTNGHLHSLVYTHRHTLTDTLTDTSTQANLCMCAHTDTGTHRNAHTFHPAKVGGRLLSEEKPHPCS